MRFPRPLSKLILAAAAVFFGLLLSNTLAHAYPPPAASATTTQSCPSATQGASCALKFNFVNSSNQPVTGATVAFSVSGAGSVSPATGTTDTSGNVATTFTASTTSCGNAVVTATSGTASAQTTVGVVCAAASLPNTSADPPGANPLAYAGIVLAALALVGGAFALRLSRRPI